MSLSLKLDQHVISTFGYHAHVVLVPGVPGVEETCLDGEPTAAFEPLGEQRRSAIEAALVCSWRREKVGPTGCSTRPHWFTIPEFCSYGIQTSVSYFRDC